MKNLLEFASPVTKLGRNFYLAGLGVAGIMTQETGKVFDKMVERGQATSKSESENTTTSPLTKLSDRLEGVVGKVGERVNGTVTKTMGRFGIPSQNEIRELTNSIEKLTEKVRELQPSA